MRVKVRMLKQIRGARDGVTLETFEAGQEVEFAETAREQDLLQIFLREGWAEEIRARGPAPENASLGQAPENAERPAVVVRRRR